MWVKSQSQSFTTLAPKILALNFCLILKKSILCWVKVKVEENPKLSRLPAHQAVGGRITVEVKIKNGKKPPSLANHGLPKSRPTDVTLTQFAGGGRERINH